MTVYRLVIGHSIRYIRALNMSAARVRAFKVWHARPDIIEPFGMMAPDIGAFGYSRACNALENVARTSATLRAMQSHKGADNTGRNMYRPKGAALTKLENKALAIMRRYGMAA